MVSSLGLTILFFILFDLLSCTFLFSSNCMLVQCVDLRCLIFYHLINKRSMKFCCGKNRQKRQSKSICELKNRKIMMFLTMNLVVCRLNFVLKIVCIAYCCRFERDFHLDWVKEIKRQWIIEREIAKQTNGTVEECYCCIIIIFHDVCVCVFGFFLSRFCFLLVC